MLFQKTALKLGFKLCINTLVILKAENFKILSSFLYTHKTMVQSLIFGPWNKSLILETRSYLYIIWPIIRLEDPVHTSNLYENDKI